GKMLRYMKCLIILSGVFFLLYFGLHPLSELFGDNSPPDLYQEFTLINTSQCHLVGRKIPPPITRTRENILSLRCNKVQLLFTDTRSDGNYLMPSQIFEELWCQYWLYAPGDWKTDKLLGDGQFNLMPYAHDGFKVGTGRQTVRVLCKSASKETKYHDVHLFLPPPEPDLIPKHENDDKMSVLILGIDSLSQMVFLRNFPFLTGLLSYLPNTALWGYSRVGLGAYENVMALLSGRSIDELDPDWPTPEDETKSPSDVEARGPHFLWEKFKAAGYRTAYGEDTAQSFASRTERWRFAREFPEYNLHPIMLEMDRYTRYSIDVREMIHCTAGREFGGVLRDFITSLVPHFKQSPFFSFFWESQGVEEYYQYSRTLDVAYLMLLKRLEEENILNKTLVLLVSGHGLRKGNYRMSYQGMQEESQPLLVAIYPEWLKAKYPRAISNLETNSRRLVTPYDLHETLEDVLHLDQLKDSNLQKRMRDLESKDGKNMPRGISLFLPIPDARTCDMAEIPSLFCFCRDLTEVPTDDGLVLRCSRFLVKSINEMLKPYPMCQQLRLHMVLVAYFVDFGEESFIYELRLRVKTMPGEGVFEGTVRLTDQMHLTSPINRISRYLSRSTCIEEPYIKTMCHCL
ncbi:hypothetical protein KR074_010263, partial [Drosophila pseudoananassae]